MATRNDRDEHMHSDGTTALETLSLIIPSIITVFTTTTLVSILPRNKKLHYFVEFIILLTPMILNITVGNCIAFIIISELILCGSLLCLVHKCGFKPNVIENEKRRIPFITNARATINILSIIAILAVDFQVFPRKFAKTSTFGFSLMDLGVGLYIFANSIVSPECLNKKDTISKIIKSCIPLLILGLSRFFLTSQVNYHVPHAEYGIHWNFFFTLLFTKCISSSINKIAHVRYMLICSILVLVIHEILLQCFLQDIVMNNEPRSNFFLANKEGISSILGYVSLYLFAVYFGHILNDNVYGSFKVKENVIMFTAYLIATGTLAFLLNSKYGTSRRLTNASYCLWVTFVGILAALLFYLGELIQSYAFGKKLNYVKSPYVYQAINFNALIFFLLGNIFTGVINTILDTWAVNDISALVILHLYIFIVTLVMCTLYEYKIKIKL